MSEDMNNKIKQLTEMLGQENMPENVKGLLNLLAGSASGEGSSQKSDTKPAAKTEAAYTERNEESRSEKRDDKRSDDNNEFMRKARSMMDMLGANSDSRVNLLYALKPFLNNKRQKKLNNCINLLRMSSLTRLMDNHEKGES